MGNSTISVHDVFDRVAAKGIPTPLTAAVAGYTTDMAVAMASDVMREMIKERFNWKWNRQTAAAFLTNSFQQDYPQIGVKNIAWLEDCDRVDINNTQFPKPLKSITVRRQLSRTSDQYRPIAEICWMFNKDLSYGTWPGAGIRFNPLVTANVLQNPLMSMVDANGNLLTLTTFGTTGVAAPAAAVASAEGFTVNDGSCVWTVVNPYGQGFRVDQLPGAAGPVYQLIPYYQCKAPTITLLSQMIDPIPDDYSNYFQKGLEAYCLKASPNPADKLRGDDAEIAWIRSMVDAKQQGDREPDAYGILPATQVVDSIFGSMRNPQDPSQPY